jgi:hypothetical protein
MSTKSFILTLLCVFTIQLSFSQINTNRKKLPATRTTTPPKIDGVLEDAAWKNVPVAKDFMVFRPNNGAKEPDTHKTEVKLIYDNDAIYISAIMYDPAPKKIPAEFTNRDNIGNADFFLVTINPNDDGQNPFEFIVTSSGAQADSKISNGNEDFNWSAVWESGFKITDKGWTVEMKIPYRALRFSNQPIQSWGINFHRRVQISNSQFTWNNIDNTKGNWTQYDGLFEDFKNIKPPTRLAFYPYASTTNTTYDGKSEFSWSAGMDVKYGITENFTLDATLIPDFGQTAFDNVTLNLGPFEQQFDEQRQFFTEGTELFTKGRLFYSRRIGGSPIRSAEAGINETVIDEPGSVKMLNAIKVSGRTKKGLGIGIFNAITGKTEATIQNDITKEVRKEVTNPVSNYNILVLDQQFNQNSSVTLINTNVKRAGDFRDANATGLLWHLEDKKSSYNVDGSFKFTKISDDIDNPNVGKTFDLSIGKHSGKWRGEIGYNFEDKNYNPNDLGILFSNNEQTIYGHLGYRLLKPKGIFNNMGVNLFYNVNFLHTPGTYTGTGLNMSFWANTKKLFNFGANINFNTKRKDFNEPRQGNTSGIYFERPLRLNVNHYGNTNRTKKLSLSYSTYYTYFKNDPKKSYGFDFRPKYRFSNQFSVQYGFEVSQTKNDVGYVTTDNSDIIFGQRDRSSYENSISGKYNFSSNSSLSLSFRHNWSKVPYRSQFLELNTTSGTLENSGYTGDHNVNFNSWNLDVNYIWQFAPGSQLIAFYRHSIFSQSDQAHLNFFDNLDKLFEEPNQHTFSLRMVYFIDYNKLKNIF